MTEYTDEQLAYAYQVGFEDGSRCHILEVDHDDTEAITAIAVERGEAWMRQIRDREPFRRL